MGRMGAGGTECESKVQSLGTWARRCYWQRKGKPGAAFGWRVSSISNLHFPEEGKTEGKPCIYGAQLFLETLT